MGPANGVMGWPAVCDLGISIFTLKICLSGPKICLKNALQCLSKCILFILDLPDMA